MAKLTYIYHDCFVFETGNTIFVFDFWKDPYSDKKALPYFLEIADKTKKLVVLVSHHHKDHYNKHIFEWWKYFKNTQYILSKDTAKYCRHIIKPDSLYNGIKPPQEDIVVIEPGQIYAADNFMVSAFESTDIGNSYVLTIEGKKIFHAGDLNAWTWREESAKEEIDEMTKKFISILNAISVKYKNFDIVMFPVDPRMGSGFYEGAKLFNEKFKTDYFCPMHFCLAESDKEEICFKEKIWDTEKYINTNVRNCILMTSPYSALKFS